MEIGYLMVVFRGDVRIESLIQFKRCCIFQRMSRGVYYNCFSVQYQLIILEFGIMFFRYYRYYFLQFCEEGIELFLGLK